MALETLDLHKHIDHIKKRAETLSPARFAPSQQPFISHIGEITKHLSTLFQDIPRGQLAYFYVLPTLGEELQRRVVALYGYAQLLTGYTELFDNASLTDQDKETLSTIYSEGVELALSIGECHQRAAQWRITQRKQEPQSFELGQLLRDYIDIYRYFLGDTGIGISVVYEPCTEVIARPYHVSELIMHIIGVLCREMLNPQNKDQEHVTLRVKDNFLDIRTLHGIWEIETSAVLFYRHERGVYISQLEKDNGKIQILGGVFGDPDIRLTLTKKTTYE